MDQDLAALSMAAATTLVTLMTTDGWERAKEAFVAIFKRSSHQKEAMNADLTASRLEVLAAHEKRDEQAALEAIYEWRNRVQRLASTNETLLDELCHFIEVFEPQTRGAAAHTSITMHATASGFGRIYQAGGDQTINER